MTVLEIPLLVGALALADAINPVTIAVALYLASAERPHARAAAFTAGVLAVYGMGGAALLLGPGQLLASAAASADTRAFHTASVIAGAVLVIAGLMIMRRSRTASVTAAVDRLGPRSAFALGASVTVLDLPTAFPYFAAIAAIANSDAAVPVQLAMLAGFNAIYVAPLVAIAALPVVAGRRWREIAGRARAAVDRFATRAVAALTAVMGGALILRGADGLLG
jgi:cytochrome c biogenesis protein CcdA